jgi:hypothetical protein
MSWDLSVNKPSTNEEGGSKKTNFTKFEFGVTEIRVLDKVPFMRWSHWLPQYSRRITCPGIECPICKMNKIAKANKQKEKYDNSRQWSLNLYNYNTGQHELNEQGLKFMEELRIAMEDLKEQGKELGDAVIKVTKRQGSDGRATWRMDVKQIEDDPNTSSVTLIDRAEYFKPPTSEQITALLTNPAPSVDSFVQIMTGGDKGAEPGNGKDTGDIGEEVKFETE